MSKAQDDLRAIGIVNVTGALKAYRAAVPGAHERGEDVALTYRISTAHERGGRSAAWQVYRPGYITDANAHWEDRGTKTFGCWGARGAAEAKALALGQAREWATARYGDQQWTTLPGLRHALLPAPVVAWVKAQVREARKASA